MRYDPTGYWSWQRQAAVGTAIILIGFAILLAPPTGGASLGALTLSASTIAAAGGSMVIVGTIITGDAVAQATINNAKPSRKSGKERSTQHPSWVSQNDVDLSKSAQENATDLLNKKFGKGNWGKGPTSDFNQIVKWINRCLKVLTLIISKMELED